MKRFLFTGALIGLVVLLSACSQGIRAKRLSPQAGYGNGYYQPDSGTTTEHLKLGAIMNKDAQVVAQPSYFQERVSHGNTLYLSKIGILPLGRVDDWAGAEGDEAQRYKDHFVVLEMVYTRQYGSSTSKVIGYKVYPMNQVIVP